MFVWKHEGLIHFQAFSICIFLQVAVFAASALKPPPAALFTAPPGLACLHCLLSLVHLWFNYSSALRAGHTWGSAPQRSSCLSAVVISLALIRRCSAALCRTPRRAGRGGRARRSPRKLELRSAAEGVSSGCRRCQGVGVSRRAGVRD